MWYYKSLLLHDAPWTCVHTQRERGGEGGREREIYFIQTIITQKISKEVRKEGGIG